MKPSASTLSAPLPNPRPLTHRQIEVFRTVMATGHVTRAADRLGSSQPTISRDLARLEQVLGMALFERVRGRLRPTARAQALLAEVERRAWFKNSCFRVTRPSGNDPFRQAG
ncbi:MAG: LysR family transcriptional regulator [Burkholderiales bacterium]|nr:LysR family transcriptional regulator [Burkholderiales bacterium]